jgi:hypothetical protein
MSKETLETYWFISKSASSFSTGGPSGKHYAFEKARPRPVYDIRDAIHFRTMKKEDLIETNEEGKPTVPEVDKVSKSYASYNPKEKDPNFFNNLQSFPADPPPAAETKPEVPPADPPPTKPETTKVDDGKGDDGKDDGKADAKKGNGKADTKKGAKDNKKSGK